MRSIDHCKHLGFCLVEDRKPLEELHDVICILARLWSLETGEEAVEIVQVRLAGVAGESVRSAWLVLDLF